MIRRLINLSKTQSFFLFGPRGSGKSTLLKEHFQGVDALWIDLLEQRLDFELQQDPDRLLSFWQLKKQPWIVIDEVQKNPKILDVVHRGIEDHGIRFALTGSSSRKLKRGGANLLAGRASSYELSPFSSVELGSRFDLEKALRFGLLPRFWSDSIPLDDNDRIQSLYAYVQTYLKEEVAAEQLVRKLDPFRRFLVAAAQSNGKIVNFAKIERDAGVSTSQAERHFEILCDTLIGRFLEPYHSSVRKRQTRKSKFYFFDTGVVRALHSLAGEPLHPSTYEYGDLFETFVMNEFFKLKESLGLRWSFSYLRTKDDAEIDLIIDHPKKPPTLVEIKSSARLDEDDVAKFKKISADFKKSEKFILSNDLMERVSEGIRCMHWANGIKEIFDI